MSGLVLYRFADQQKDIDDIEVASVQEQRTAELREPLLTGETCSV
jgi:hypothetical protein